MFRASDCVDWLSADAGSDPLLRVKAAVPDEYRCSHRCAECAHHPARSQRIRLFRLLGPGIGAFDRRESRECAGCNADVSMRLSANDTARKRAG